MVCMPVVETPPQTFNFCISVVIETTENRVLSIRATDYSPKMVCDNLENETKAKWQTLPPLKSDNNRHCRLQWPIKIELLKRITAALLNYTGSVEVILLALLAGDASFNFQPELYRWVSFPSFLSIHPFHLSFQSILSIYLLHSSFPAFLSINPLNPPLDPTFFPSIFPTLSFH